MQIDVQRRQTTVSYSNTLGIMDIWHETDIITQESKDAILWSAVIRQQWKSWYEHQCLIEILHILSVQQLLLNTHYFLLSPC